MISLQLLPCAKTRIQECGCCCSADDYTTATANITEMVPIRRHTTTLVHPFHHHRPHSCNCPLPIHFMLRWSLFITTDILTWKRHFLGKEEASKHPLHLSSFCAMRESASRWSPSIQIFSDDVELLCRYPSRRNAQSQRWCWASVCQLLTIVKPTVAEPPESQLSWSGPNMVATWSCSCQFCLSLDISICNRAFRPFHPFPKTARVNFDSHQPTATPPTVVSDIHYRRARVTFEVRNHFVTHQILFWCVPTQTTVAAQDIVNLHNVPRPHVQSWLQPHTLLATTSCMLPQSTLPCTQLTHRTL